MIIGPSHHIWPILCNSKGGEVGLSLPLGLKNCSDVPGIFAPILSWPEDYVQPGIKAYTLVENF